MHVCMYTDLYFVVLNYLMSLSFKFQKELQNNSDVYLIQNVQYVSHILKI